MDHEQETKIAIEVMKVLIGKLPIPCIPGSQLNFGAREEFIRNVCRDSFDLARAMMDERNNRFPQTVPTAGDPTV